MTKIVLKKVNYSLIREKINPYKIINSGNNKTMK